MFAPIRPKQGALTKYRITGENEITGYISQKNLRLSISNLKLDAKRKSLPVFNKNKSLSTLARMIEKKH